MKPVPDNQIVASVKIKIATVESPRLEQELKLENKNPVEAVIVKKIPILQLAEKVPPNPHQLF